ncbi:hypothetical protein MLD52_13495 [Puniceicoccaceae bacterium K14]|nr:hypothetical protein [Puniceicoccaceae bacterium K14]
MITKYKLVTLLALLQCVIVTAYPNEERQSDLEEKISELSAKNEALMLALQEQMELFQAQQNELENLSKRVAKIEPDSDPSITHEILNTENSANMTGMEAFEASFGQMTETEEKFKPSIDFGGWLGFVYSDDSRDSTNSGFDAHPLYLYSEAHPAERWDVFAEIEIEHIFQSNSSGTKGDLKVERLYLQHELADSSKIRMGKFFLPFGYWYNLHWHFLTETLSRPISFNNSYVPKQQVGIEYMNTLTVNDIGIKYFAWLADGPDLFATNKRTESDFSFGAAIFAEKQISSEAKLGATLAFHQQKEDFDTQRNAVLGMDFTNKRLELRSEYYYHQREIDQDLESGYISLKLKTSDTFGFVFRHDFGDDRKTSGETLDASTTSNSFGFMWRPQPHLLFKSEFRINDFKSEDSKDNYNSWNVFSAVKF